MNWILRPWIDLDGLRRSLKSRALLTTSGVYLDTVYHHDERIKDSTYYLPLCVSNAPCHGGGDNVQHQDFHDIVSVCTPRIESGSKNGKNPRLRQCHYQHLLLYVVCSVINESSTRHTVHIEVVAKYRCIRPLYGVLIRQTQTNYNGKRSLPRGGVCNLLTAIAQNMLTLSRRIVSKCSYSSTSTIYRTSCVRAFQIVTAVVRQKADAGRGRCFFFGYSTSL